MVTNHFRWDFIGLSTDEKPTPANSEKVVDGSTYYCSDTSKLYVFCKDTWYEKTATGSITVAQTTGESTTSVMSQKAVTDTINDRLDDLTLLVITASDYENLTTKDPDTLYIITAGE